MMEVLIGLPAVKPLVIWDNVFWHWVIFSFPGGTKSLGLLTYVIRKAGLKKLHKNKIVDWSMKMIFFRHMWAMCVGTFTSYLFLTFPCVHLFKIAHCVVHSSALKPHFDLWSRVDTLQAGRRWGRAFSPGRSSLRSMATTSTAVTTKRSWSTSQRSTHTRSILKWWGDTNTHKRVLIRAQLLVLLMW